MSVKESKLPRGHIRSALSTAFSRPVTAGSSSRSPLDSMVVRDESIGASRSGATSVCMKYAAEFVAKANNKPALKSWLGAPSMTFPDWASTVAWHSAHVMPARTRQPETEIVIPSGTKAPRGTSRPVSKYDPFSKMRSPIRTVSGTSTRKLVVQPPRNAKTALVTLFRHKGPSRMPSTSVKKTSFPKVSL